MSLEEFLTMSTKELNRLSVTVNLKKPRKPLISVQ